MEGGNSSNSQMPETIAGGSTALVKLLANGTHIEKVPNPDSRSYHMSIVDLRREYAIYQRLPCHPRFLQLHPDNSPDRLVLPYLEYGCLNVFLRDPSISLA